MDCRKWSDKYSTDCKLKYNSEVTQNNYISCVKNFLNKFSKFSKRKYFTLNLHNSKISYTFVT